MSLQLEHRVDTPEGAASRTAPLEAVWQDGRMEHARRPTVLIIDDHAGFRAFARALLESEGFQVIGEAPDGRSGLADARRLQPDVVLLDVQLPDADGFEVATQLAGDGLDTAVILTSSRDVRDYGTLVGECGARGFIPKAELSGAALAALAP
jgi:DNA-binding NarL/FixJ family response regulator